MSPARPSSEHRECLAAAPRDGAALRSYRVFGLVVSSELPLPELPCCSGAAAHIVVRRAAAGQVEPARFATRHEWRASGEVTCRVARGEEGYLLSLGPVDFLFTVDRQVLCAPLPGTGEGLVRHLLLNQVLPRCLAHTGELVLHASAVTLPDGRTVAFIGEAGRGKSTLAFYCHGKGARLVDDDCVLLRISEQGATVCGGVPTVRLHIASLNGLGADPAAFAPVAGGSDKWQMYLGHTISRQAAPVELDALFLLGAGDTGSTVDSVWIEPATGRAAVVTLAGSAFNLDPSAHDTMVRTFRHVSRLVNAVPVYHLRYPREYALLPQVWQALLAHSGP